MKANGKLTNAKRAIEETFFEESVYADDMNAYRSFLGSTNNDIIMEDDICYLVLYIDLTSPQNGLRVTLSSTGGLS